MYKIQTLNNISVKGLERLPRESYEVATEIANPDAILVRSAKMHDMTIADTVKAIGRAGAGVNNIPVDAMSQRGVAVFNAPGANANAVKELVLAAMLLTARNIPQAWDFARQQEGDDATIDKAVEAGKKNFVGFELPGRTLGVIGLGAIGVLVANAARALGMNVIGYDPEITVNRAWQLSAEVQQAHSVDELLARSQFVSVHVPLMEATKDLVNAERLRLMPENSVILNFSRAGIVNDQAVIDALDEKRLWGYACDFPSNLTKSHPRVVALPHLGASTTEAEENCAIMVAEQVKDYLENGNVRNSVNFPELVMPRSGRGERLAIVNANVPNMLGQISAALGEAEVNIVDMFNKSRDEVAYTLVDVEGELPEAAVERIRAVSGVLNIRVIR